MTKTTSNLTGKKQVIKVKTYEIVKEEIFLNKNKMEINIKQLHS